MGGSSFYEVTFEARVGQGHWRSVGTDDTAPYQVFHDVNELRPGTRVDYRATVLAAAVTPGRARSAVPGSRRRSLAAGTAIAYRATLRDGDTPRSTPASRRSHRHACAG